jgi:hypothetical protein
MTRISEKVAWMRAKATWSVVVVYEDDATRERAVSFCDDLVGRFWARLAFEVSWWSFAQIEALVPANEAAEKAARADLVVLSTAPEGDLAPALKRWLESWLPQRGEREGILVGLIDQAERPPGAEGAKHGYLRNAAHRAGLDYLTQVPQDLGRTMPDSLDSFGSRADHVTTLLDNILHQQPPPPGPLP